MLYRQVVVFIKELPYQLVQGVCGGHCGACFAAGLCGHQATGDGAEEPRAALPGRFGVLGRLGAYKPRHEGARRICCHAGRVPWDASASCRGIPCPTGQGRDPGQAIQRPHAEGRLLDCDQ